MNHVATFCHISVFVLLTNIFPVQRPIILNAYKDDLRESMIPQHSRALDMGLPASQRRRASGGPGASTASELRGLPPSPRCSLVRSEGCFYLQTSSDSGDRDRSPAAFPAERPTVRFHLKKTCHLPLEFVGDSYRPACTRRHHP